MNRKLFLISTLILSTILSSGCKKHVNYIESEDARQENIFQYYKVSYQSDTKELTVIAAFTVDHKTGTPIKLSDHSKVSFNDTELEWNINDKEGFYQTIIDDKLPAKLCFQYTNNNDSTFLNNLILNTFSIDKEMITLQKSQGNFIQYKGKRLGVSESVICRLVQDDKEPVEIETSVEGQQVVIYPEFLDGIQPGTYTGYFVRKNFSNELAAMDRGGFIESEYISTKKQITIK
ncbi:MAG: hypothetical protein PHQ33_05655 [Bacteroidales bacterium]|nr:hypothetical protein [Bacteroidales bacterium]